MNSDKLITERFPNSKIYRLQAERKESKMRKFLRNVRLIYADNKPGVTENMPWDSDMHFYLIQHDLHYYIAVVLGNEIESDPVDDPTGAGQFEYEGWNFIIKEQI